MVNDGEQVPAGSVTTLNAPRVHTPTLVDAQLDEQLRTRGFAVIDLLDETTLGSLQSLFTELHPVPSSTWESDFYDEDPNIKRRVHQEVAEAFAPSIDRLFCDHRTVLHNFVANWPGPDGGLPLHQHSSIVDPAKFSSVVVWCALNEATESNGTLHVVEASHLVQVGPRPERTTSWHEAVNDELLTDYLTTVEIGPGQALVFDNQLLHCSFANQTDSPRLTAVAIVIPRGATPLFYERSTDTTASVYRLDPEFFLSTEPGQLEWGDPNSLELLDTQEWTAPEIAESDLSGLLPRGNCRHPKELVLSSESTSGVVNISKEPPPTLRDSQAQSDLDEFGFAVVEGLSGELLEAVRSAYASLGPAPDDPQRAINWTFHSRSTEHKYEVKDRLEELVGNRLDEIFVDHVSYLTSFITKWPGPDGGFAPHQDPTLVDERSWTGVTIWMPLDDTHPIDGVDSGMLHFVPGSHRFGHVLRVSDVDYFAFAEHETAILENFGVAVPLRAGEALVFDNRAIHYSMPNTSDAPRVVLAFGMRPRTSPSVIARYLDDQTIAVHALPENFFIDIAPAAQHEWQPTDAPLVTSAVMEERWTADEFAALCTAVRRPPRSLSRDEFTGTGWTDPGAFCALCGTTVDIADDDRARRNNAQLVCSTCREGLLP